MCRLVLVGLPICSVILSQDYLLSALFAIYIVSEWISGAQVQFKTPKGHSRFNSFQFYLQKVKDFNVRCSAI